MLCGYLEISGFEFCLGSTCDITAVEKRGSAHRGYSAPAANSPLKPFSGEDYLPKS